MSPYSIASESSLEIGSQVQKSLFYELADLAIAVWLEVFFTDSL